MESLLHHSIDCEIEYSRLLNLPQDEQGKLDNYQAQLEAARDRFDIALTVEPTAEEISNLENDVSDATVIEVILMEMRTITSKYAKRKNMSKMKK